MKILHNYRVGGKGDMYPWFITHGTIKHKAIRLQTVSNNINYILDAFAEHIIKYRISKLTPIGTSWKSV